MAKKGSWGSKRAYKKARKGRRKRRAGKCVVVTVCGKRRRLCYGKKGIVSNRPAGKRRKRR